MKNNFLLESFLDFLKSCGKTSCTISAYAYDIKSFLEKCKKIEDVDEQYVSDFLKQLKLSGISSRSVNRKISSLKNFFNFLQDEKIIEKNPVNNFSQLKTSKSLPKSLDKELVDRMLDLSKFESSRFNLMLHLLYFTGLRVSELVSLSFDHIIVISRKDFNIEPFFIIKGKGNKERIVPFSNEVKHLLIEYISVNKINKGYVFISPKHGHISRNNFFIELKKFALKNNIDPTKISPHKFRHSYASHMLENGIDLRTLQELLGHESINTTQIYTYINSNQLKNVIIDFHPLCKVRI